MHCFICGTIWNQDWVLKNSSCTSHFKFVRRAFLRAAVCGYVLSRMRRIFCDIFAVHFHSVACCRCKRMSRYDVEVIVEHCNRYLMSKIPSLSQKNSSHNVSCQHHFLKIFTAFFRQCSSNLLTLTLIMVSSSGPRLCHPLLYDPRKHCHTC